MGDRIHRATKTFRRVLQMCSWVRVKPSFEALSDLALSEGCRAYTRLDCLPGLERRFARRGRCARRSPQRASRRGAPSGHHNAPRTKTIDRYYKLAVEPLPAKTIRS